MVYKKKFISHIRLILTSILVVGVLTTFIDPPVGLTKLTNLIQSTDTDIDMGAMQQLESKYKSMDDLVECKLPHDSNLQYINEGGWATESSYCKGNSWCPYACKPGYYSLQFDPSATCSDKTRCGSLNGGIFCTADGKVKKPFKEKDLCRLGMDNLYVDNSLDTSVSICQTVYPGSEIMLIPTVVEPQQMNVRLTSPPSTTWMGSGAHYYINLPNSNQKSCIWGSPNKPEGNWAPYVLGVNQGYQGLTYLNLMVNPNYVNKFNEKDKFRVKLVCLSGNCKGEICEITSVDKKCTMSLNTQAKAKLVLC